MSVDPLSPSYPWYTPYQFAGNMPIAFIDLDGLEPASAGKEYGEVQRAADNNSGSEDDWTWYGEDSGWLANSGTASLDISSRDLDRRDFLAYPETDLSSTPDRYRRSNSSSFLLDIGLNNIVNEELIKNKRLIGSANSLSDVIDFSLKGYDYVYFRGSLLDKVQNDPAMIGFQESVIEEAQGSEKYGKEEFYTTGSKIIQFGGDRGSFNPLDSSFKNTFSVATNPLTWAIRHAEVKYWLEVGTNGAMKLEYRINDVLDLSPQDYRSSGYNVISIITGTVYHGLLGGNRNFQSRAEWLKYKNK